MTNWDKHKKLRARILAWGNRAGPAWGWEDTPGPEQYAAAMGWSVAEAEAKTAIQSEVNLKRVDVKWSPRAKGAPTGTDWNRRDDWTGKRGTVLRRRILAAINTRVRTGNGVGLQIKELESE